MQTPKNFKPNPNYSMFTVSYFKAKNYEKLLLQKFLIKRKQQNKGVDHKKQA